MMLQLDKNTEHYCSKKTIRPHHHWRKRWKKFIKYDHDFSGEFLVELVLHKLYLLRDYFVDTNCLLASEELLKIQEEIKSAISLGENIIRDEYDNVSHTFLNEHTRPGISLVVIGERAPEFTSIECPSVWGEFGSSITMGYMDELNSRAGQVFAPFIKEHHLTAHDYTYGYTSGWDSPKNQAKYRGLGAQAQTNRDEDYKKFFGTIADNCQKWWD